MFTFKGNKFDMPSSAYFTHWIRFPGSCKVGVYCFQKYCHSFNSERREDVVGKSCCQNCSYEGCHFCFFVFLFCFFFVLALARRESTLIEMSLCLSLNIYYDTLPVVPFKNLPVSIFFFFFFLHTTADLILTLLTTLSYYDTILTKLPLITSTDYVTHY